MILPVYVYGQPVLREVAKDITPDYPNLSELIQNMRETMHHADGIGLAAPQIGLPIRLVVMDLTPLGEDFPELADYQKTFINPYIVEVDGDDITMGEGCLSLPGIGEDVTRPDIVYVKYMDENFVEHEEKVEGYLARVMQHEFDHLDGIMFVDHISPLRKQMVRSKLNKMVKCTARTHYKIKSVGK